MVSPELSQPRSTFSQHCAHSTFYPRFVHSELVVMVVSEPSQPISTSFQHCAHSTFYQHCAQSQFVLMIGFLAQSDHINILSTLSPLNNISTLCPLKICCVDWLFGTFRSHQHALNILPTHIFQQLQNQHPLYITPTN